MEYLLKKEDYEDINGLIRISVQIKKMYDELYQLELSGKKATAEYKAVIERLKSTLFVESNIYERIGTSYDKTLSILDYLKQNELSLQEYDEELPIFSSNLVISRILNRLMRNIVVSREIIPEELQFLLNLGNVSSQEMMRSVSASFNVKESITTDLMNCLLAIIEKEHNGDSKVDSKLKDMKYIVSYLYKSIENNLVKNCFEIEKNPYIEAMLVGQINHWPKEAITRIKKLYGLNYYDRTLKSMLVCDDEDLSDDRMMAKMITNQTFLRTIFLLLDDDTIMELNSNFHDLIEQDDLQKTLATRQKSVEMVINAYRRVKNDKGIPKMLSLKL